MHVFFVSLRSAEVFGPGQIQSAESPNGGFINLTVHWPHENKLDHWEGYAVVVPEKNKVWGACKPILEDETIKTSFRFTPQNIPPKDKELFELSPETNESE